MKKTLTFLLSFVLMSSSCLFAQYSDDFSEAHDYSTGVDGTMWDGVKVNEGILEVAEVAELVELNTTLTAGVLTFTTVFSYFAGNNDNGVMLYKNVEADENFTFTVQIVGGQYPSFGAGDTINYMMSGPIVRVDDPDSVKFIALQAFDRPNWGAVYGFRNINMAPEENWVSADDDENPVSIASHPWMRLSRSGSTYTGSISADGATWWDYWSEDRPDMDGFPLQVGLYSSTYTDIEGTVEFDNVTLDLPSLAVKDLQGEQINVFYSPLTKTINFASADMSNAGRIQIVNIAGQVVDTVNDFTGNSIDVSRYSEGLYIVAISDIEGRVYSKKVVVF